MDGIKNGVCAPSTGAKSDKDDFWKRALQVSERRLSVLASNIANADTPNYKARDIDFRAAMQQALLEAAPVTDAADKARCGVGVSNSESQPNIFPRYRIPVQSSVDGNTVDMDTERGAFAEQAVKHQFLLQKVADEYKEMDSMLKNLVG
ncbi:flagellar basal body rod protein FlgB [Massilia sp. YIM B02763]|uniref:flagellar basal body rod protein FlgB n=1 Tax=Massilia sp. YIM B02763 TaxID=3050130 RepID=UPI0025B6B2B8|nr:flagellar basal body rod protein FlgB [Massilia sp. YIM B02763]MDN4053142.1 flagellar basal body rod protein FlgB [Massilia sp. YIM B02763]